MKTFRIKSGILVTALLFTIAAVTVSCSKEDVVEPETSQQELQLKKANSNAPGAESIALVAINNGFSELVDALTYVDTALNAGLVNLFLNGTDQYTVFAPTNAAFQNLYTTLGITDITDLPAPLVLDVLQYHVTEGRRAAKSVVPKKGIRKITTLLNKNFTVDTQASITAIGNTANITTPDVSASNGIIHIIDAVILPI